MRPVDAIVPISPQSETSSSLRKSASQFAEVVNLAPTEEGSLRSVQGPADLIRRTYAPYSSGSPLTYGTVYSVGYASLQGGQRHVLLMHENNQIRVFEGWNRAWKTLIGSDAGAQITESVEAPKPGERGARFVATANGVVIFGPRSRAYFYDGEVVGYLGYSSPPSAPHGAGPTSSTPNGQFGSIAAGQGTPGTNDLNYASDGLLGWNHSTHRSLLGGRLGTTSTAGSVPFSGGLGDEGAGVKGYLLPGIYRAYTQFIDRWGNLSPISPASNDIKFEQQAATHLKNGAVTPTWAQVDLVKKRVLWQSISKGPRGTIGRVCGRTKDLLNSGTSEKFVLPQNAAGVLGSYATLEDNITDVYTDNIPDEWLVTTMTEVDPVPEFREADVAFGRLWVAGLEDDPSAIMISMPGRWGTFPANSRRYPDPRGAAIVAIKAIPQGVLVFTRSSTFLYRANDAGDEFISEPISTSRGCHAPGSIATLPNGMTIWAGRDGFYGFDGKSVLPLWRNRHEYLAAEHNLAALARATAVVDKRTGEYRCWVAVRGSLLPDRCYTTTDGNTWRFRTDSTARAACSLDDDDQLTIIAGQSGGAEGVWVMDRGQVAVTAYLDSGWLQLASDSARANALHVFVQLRETNYTPDTPRTQAGDPIPSPNQVTLEVYRDYRGEVKQSSQKPTYAPTTSGPSSAFWLRTPTNEATIRRARPYWVRFDIDAASAEALRFKLSCPGEVEIMEVSYGTQQVTSGKRNF